MPKTLAPSPGEALFSGRDLWKLIFPLIIEQILAITIGMADTVMVAGNGEAAVSGIALIDTINILLINIFSALATGGAVVSAQYLGRQEPHNACKAAKQLVYATLGLSVAIMAVCLWGKASILNLAFGNVAPDVMHNALIYFSISAMSYPFIALYNAGAALFRSMGNSKISMFTALLMNVVNISGNAITIYGLGMGVRGAAVASLCSRVLGCVVMLVLLQNRHNPIHLERLAKWEPDGPMVKSILRIGVPGGLENGMFQVGKVLVQGLIASFGTAAIAANAVAGNVANMQILPGSAIGLALITVVGQCMGAGDHKQAQYYTIKLMKIAYLGMLGLNAVILLLSVPLVEFYGMAPETTATALQLLILHSIMSMLVWPLAFTLPNALRAAADARFTMTVSILSMWTCRIGLSYLLARGLGMGVVGVWTAMGCDWLVRSTFFVTRFLRGKWKTHTLI